MPFSFPPKVYFRTLSSVLTLRRLVVLFCIGTVIIIVGVTLAVQDADYRNELASHYTLTDNLALLYEQHTQYTFHIIEQTLRAIQSEYQLDGPSEHLRFSVVHTQSMQNELIGMLSVADASGNVMINSHKLMDTPNLYDRTYFAYHRQNPTGELYIATPLISVITGRWIIPVSLRLNRPDGGFAGVVVASINPDYFANFFGRANLGRQGLVLLLNREGHILSAYAPHMQVDLDQRVEQTTLFNQLQPQTGAGQHINATLIDGISRLRSYRTLKDYPLVILVGIAQSEAMTSHEDHKRLIYWMAIFLASLVIGFGAVTMRQIDQGERSRNALERSEARFRTMWFGAPQGVVLIRDGRVLQANPAFARMLGYEHHTQLGGLEIDNLLAPQVSSLVHQRSIRRQKGLDEPSDYVTIGQRCSGEQFPAQISAVQIHLPDGPASLGFVRDISEQKRAEDALRQVKENLEFALEATNSSIFDNDFITGQVTSSPALYRSMGYTQAEIPGDMDSLLPLIHPEDLAAVQAAMDRHLSGLAAHYYAEFRMRARNGEWIWVNGVGKVTRWDEAGHPANLFGISTTISERKQAEIALQDLNATLEQRVRERTAQLESANRELEAFSYSISHDLRAPLRALDGYSHILITDYPADLDAQGQEYLRRIRASVQRMARLIDDLLQLAYVTRCDLHLGAVNLSLLAQSIQQKLTQSNPQRQVTWTIQPDLSVQGDAVLLGIVLTNLLENSWKFTSRHAAAHIQLGDMQLNGERVFFVRDDGVGFDMQFSDKLFETFQRLHGIQEFEGTGIGLALAGRIITRHGGRIWGEAAVERGATFYFTLPE